MTAVGQVRRHGVVVGVDGDQLGVEALGVDLADAILVHAHGRARDAAAAQQLEGEAGLVDLADALERRVVGQPEHLLEPHLVGGVVEQVAVTEGGAVRRGREERLVAEPHVGALGAAEAPGLGDVARVGGGHRVERLARAPGR